jgi:hypothetical protein
LRLTAIRSSFRFVSFEEPAHSALIQRVLAIPSKRHDKRQVRDTYWYLSACPELMEEAARRLDRRWEAKL